ncbi:MAG: 2-hydroxyacid dehydrogenase [Flavobacteriaceae bacterium]
MTNTKQILHVDENHPLLIEGLEFHGYTNVKAYHTPLEEIKKNLHLYEGLVVRSRFPIDREFLNRATALKFIARLGAGLENIDVEYADSKNIKLFAAPEGNRNAVGEHALGLLLSLMNKLRLGHQSIQNGNWLREEHRGWEIEGKTVGIIGYGNTGKSFSKKLKGFDARIIFHDIQQNLEDNNAKQVPLNILQNEADILSLHIPQTSQTIGMIDSIFIENMKKPFWLINTARGKAVVTKDLVSALESGKILGAGLDVLEHESSSFQSVFKDSNPPFELTYLLKAENVLLSPHVGGWTVESHRKLAQTILKKIVQL